MSASKRHMSVKKNPYESKLFRLKHQIATIQEEREEVINLINFQVDRDILTAEELLILGQNELNDAFDGVYAHLENCIEKLLVIKVQLLSEENETKNDEKISSLTGISGSQCNYIKFGNNFHEEEKEEERKTSDVESNHAIQGNSTVRSSPFLEPFSPFSTTQSSSHNRHCCDEQGEETKRHYKQTNHADHYYVEGLEQKGDSTLSTSTTKPSSCISQTSSLCETNFSGVPTQFGDYQIRKSSNNSSFEEQEYVVHSRGRNNHITDVTNMHGDKPPIPSSMSAGDSAVSECGPHKVTPREVPQIMMKSYSNEEIIFRMADERQHQQLGHVPQEHNWSDFSARLSLPSLDPPESFRDNASNSELAPPQAACMHRTPELVNIMQNKSSEGEDVYDMKSDVPQGNVMRPKIIKQDSSDTKTTTTSSCDRFDTASSDIYFSQDGNSPPDLSLSDSPPLFIATVNKPPLASPPPTSSSAPSYRKRTSYPKINIPIGINLSIRISHVNDPSDFWIHVNRDQVNMLFNEIQLLQEKFVQSNHVTVKTPLIGSMYATRYSSDVSWYRVEVIDLLPNSNVKILFIDYGYTIKANLTDLSILNPLLEDKPAQAFNCFLRGVQSPSGSWTGTAVEEFKNSVSFYSVRAIFHDPIIIMNQRTKHPVDLLLDWGSGEMNNVLLYLSPTEFVTNELNMPKESSKEKSVSNMNSSMKTGDLKAEMLKEKKRKNFSPIFVDAPSVPEKEYILGVISHVVSPSEFYIHIMPEEDCDGSSQLDDLREQLNEHYNNSDLSVGSSVIFPSDLSILKNSCWAAMFPTDNSWYRVRIIEILEEDEEEEDEDEKSNILHALVQYIDYGNIEVVTLDELRPLSTEIANTPALAVKCHLAYIKPDGNKWSEEALSFFEQLSGFEQETLVTAHLVYKPNRIDFNTSLSVLLWNNNANNNNIDFESDVTEGHDVLINALMVNESLAITDSIEWMEEVEKIHTDQEVSQKVSLVQEVTKRILEESIEPVIQRDSDHMKRDDDEEEIVEEEEEIDEEEEEDDEIFGFSPFDLSRLAIDSIVLLKITHVVSPDEFYGILPSGSNTLDEVECESMQELMAKIETAPIIAQMKQMCDNLIQLLKQESTFEHFSDSIQINQVALVKKDEIAFRGRITKYSAEREAYEVLDIDTGMKMFVSPRDVRKLPPEFLSIPAFCVKCKLANIQPVNGDSWSIESIDTFKRDTEGNSFAAHVISRSDGVLLVELVGLDEDNTISVCEYLVNLGFGREVVTPEPQMKPTSETIVTSSKPPIPSARKRRGSSDSQGSKIQIFLGESEKV